MKPLIMLVDDDDKDRNLLETLLEPEGYAFINAKNAEEAFDSLKTAEPDLILLDILMPGISGYGIMEEIRKNKKTKLIPVILITALSGREDRLKGINAGADDFITKPFDKAELVSRVRTQTRLSVLRRQVAEKEKLAGVMDLMREGAVITDDDFKVIQINTVALEMLEQKEPMPNLAELLTLKYGVTIEKESPGSRVTLSAGAAAVGPLFLYMEYRKVTGAGGEPGYYLFVFKDATEEHTRTRIILDYLTAVSAKLNTPMTVISGYAQILDFFAADEKLKDSVSSIMKNSLIMQNLIKRILYFASIENTSAAGPLNMINMKDLTEKLALTYNKPCQFQSDRDSISVQYWQKIAAEEIIENAFKYNDKEKLILKVVTGQDFISIEDNGPGIVAEEREKVFEMFYEVNNNLPKITASAGLGLSIVKKLAEESGYAVSLSVSDLGGLKILIEKQKENTAQTAAG